MGATRCAPIGLALFPQRASSVGDQGLSCRGVLVRSSSAKGASPVGLDSSWLMFSGVSGGLNPTYRTSFDVWKPPFPARHPREQQMAAVVDSCFNKAVLGLVAGGGGGFLFGIVLGAMPGAQMDSMDQSQKAERVTGMRPKMRLYFGETISKAKGMGRTFAGFSVLYGGSEGLIEKYRGKHDLLNAVAGGAFTGAAMAWRSGPGAMAGGAVFIGAFSFAIDYYMESYTSDEVRQLEW